MKSGFGFRVSGFGFSPIGLDLGSRLVKAVQLRRNKDEGRRMKDETGNHHPSSFIRHPSGEQRLR